MRKLLVLILSLPVMLIAMSQPARKKSFTEKNIELPNHIKLNYIEQGHPSGVPIIFLHGYTDSWHSFETVMPYLPASVHVFAVTHRGHGNSDKPTGDYSPSVFAADIAAFMKELKIERAVLVGHSMSATIVQRFVLDYPQLTKAIVLVGAMASFTENKPVIEFSKAVQNLTDPIDPAFASEFQKSTLAKPIAPSALDTYINESLKVPAVVWKAILESLIKVDYTVALKKVNKPALLLWGDKDEFGQRADQDKLLKALHGSKLVVYPGNGHAPHWEEPENFANDIVKFSNAIK